jgi:hypothetical protein
VTCVTPSIVTCDHFGTETLPGGDIVRMQAVLTVTAPNDPERMSFGITLDTRQAEVLGMEEEDRLCWLLSHARERLAGAVP